MHGRPRKRDRSSRVPGCSRRSHSRTTTALRKVRSRAVARRGDGDDRNLDQPVAAQIVRRAFGVARPDDAFVPGLDRPAGGDDALHSGRGARSRSPRRARARRASLRPRACLRHGRRHRGPDRSARESRRRCAPRPARRARRRPHNSRTPHSVGSQTWRRRMSAGKVDRLATSGRVIFSRPARGFAPDRLAADFHRDVHTSFGAALGPKRAHAVTGS